jgi:Esterase-like activity of phytase
MAVLMSARTIAMMALLAACVPAVHVLQAQAADTLQCRPAGELVRVEDIAEASGIAASRRNPGTFWAINDSGQPVIFALDAKGTVTGRVRLTGARLEDWEAVAVGPCGSGSCLYVGDIGDNNGTRKQITIYRVPEPAIGDDMTATAEVFHATYPDGPQDAESLVLTSDGSLYIVTKGEKGSVALYRFPRELHAGSTMPLQRVAKPRDPGKSPNSERITDAAASPQGDWIVLRTNRAATFHHLKELMAGNWRPAHVVDLADLDEPQGEGVTLTADGTLVVVGEGGGKSAPGTLARLTCAPLR